MTHIKLFQQKTLLFSIILAIVTSLLIYMIIYTKESKFLIGAFTLLVIQLVYMLRNNKKYYFRYNSNGIEWFLPHSEDKFSVQIAEIKKVTTDATGISIYTKNNELKRLVFNYLDAKSVEEIKAYFNTLTI